MWVKLLNINIGYWLIIAPLLLDYNSEARYNGYILGIMIIVLSVMAMWQVTRLVRKANYFCAIWLLLAPWILKYSYEVAIISDMLSGFILFFIYSYPRKVEILHKE